MSPAVGSSGTARQCAEHDELVEAERILREILDADERNADAWFQLGEISQKQGRPAQAIACYRSAIKHRHSHLEARLGLASTLASQKEYRDSADTLLEVLVLHPDHADALSGLAINLAEQKRFDEALQRRLF